MKREVNRHGRRRRFRAPLSTGAWAGGIILTVVLCGMAVGFLAFLAQRAKVGGILAATVLFLTGPITGLFAVLGYEVRRKELWVRRPLWTSRIPLEGLQAARVDPHAMRRAWKTAGNSGAFGWIGWFRSKRLGNFRALVTNPALAVVLDFGKRRIVVSPDQPEAFVRALGFDPEEADTEETEG